MLFDTITISEGGEVVNATIDSGTAFPLTPSLAEIFYRTDNPNEGLYVYDGSQWMLVGQGGTVSLDGLNIKPAVRAATTTNITLSSAQTIDGVSVITGDRVLVKNQSNAIQNGIYDVDSAGPWTRASDFDGSPSTEVKAGDFVFVTEGTTNGDTGWLLTTNGTITVGTTSLTFSQFTGTNAGPGGITNAIQYNSSGTFAGSSDLVWNDSTKAMTVNGSIGVGTAPIVRMHIHEPSSAPTRLKLSNTDTGTGQVTDGLDIIMNATGSFKANFINREAGEMGFWTSATERLKITASGDVEMVGTGLSNRIAADFSSAGATRTYITTTTANSTANVGVIPSGTGTRANLTVFNTSNIATASQYGQFIADSVSVRIDSGGFNLTQMPITFSFQNAEALRIENNSRVGHRVTSPAYYYDLRAINFASSQAAQGYALRANVNADLSGSGWLAGLFIESNASGQSSVSIYVPNATTAGANTAQKGIEFFGSGANVYAALYAGGSERLRITPTGAISTGASGTATGASGEVLTSNGSGSAPSWQENKPVRLPRSTSFTSTLADRGNRIVISAGITLPSGVYSGGDAFSFYNSSASPVTITQGSGLTLRQDGTANTGSRTLAAFGTCFVWYNTASEAVISGSVS